VRKKLEFSTISKEYGAHLNLRAVYIAIKDKQSVSSAKLKVPLQDVVFLSTVTIFTLFAFTVVYD
jgi:hypothetical protein